MKFFIFYFLFSFVYCVNLLSQNSKDYKYLMRKAINNDNLNIAMQIYTVAKEDDYYDMEELRRMQAEIYYRMQDYEKTLEICKNLYNEEESNTLVNIIYMCMLARQSTKNDSLIAEVSQQTVEDRFDKNILQSMKILSNKDIDRVIDAIIRWQNKQNESKNEIDTSYRTILTLLYYYNNRFVDAYNISINYLTLNNNCITYYILGELRRRRQDYSSATTFYSISIENGYTHYDAYLQRAICRGWEKNYIASNMDLDTCIMIDSNYYAFYLKGINYSHLYQYQDAIVQFNYAIVLNDTFADGYNYRGLVESNLKEYEFAILDFKRAISLNNKTPFAHNNLGIAYENLGRLADAIKEYKLSTKYEPYLGGGWYNLGRVYTNFGITNKAIKYLNKAANLDAEISDIYYLLGINYQNKGDKQNACKYYLQALELQHTKAQDKIDNYCNKEEYPQIKEKSNKKKVSKENYDKKNKDNKEFIE